MAAEPSMRTQRATPQAGGADNVPGMSLPSCAWTNIYAACNCPTRVCETTGLSLSRVTRCHALNVWSMSTLGRLLGSRQLKVKLSIGQLHCLDLLSWPPALKKPVKIKLHDRMIRV